MSQPVVGLGTTHCFRARLPFGGPPHGFECSGDLIGAGAAVLRRAGDGGTVLRSMSPAGPVAQGLRSIQCSPEPRLDGARSPFVDRLADGYLHGLYRAELLPVPRVSQPASAARPTSAGSGPDADTVRQDDLSPRTRTPVSVHETEYMLFPPISTEHHGGKGARWRNARTKPAGWCLAPQVHADRSGGPLP
jgi:hypothetical protein